MPQRRTREALASCRVTAQCFEYGRAAALATDMSIREDVPFQEIDGVAIAERMRTQSGTG